jgi:hypothetical protein
MMLGRRKSQRRNLRALCLVAVCSLLLISRVTVAADVGVAIEADEIGDDVDEEGLSATTVTETIPQSVTSFADMRASARLYVEEEDDEDEDDNSSESEEDVPTLDRDLDVDEPFLDSGVPPILETDELEDNVDYTRAAERPTSASTVTPPPTTAGEGNKRLWGSTGSSNDAPPTDSDNSTSSPPQQQQQQQQQQQNLPFIPSVSTSKQANQQAHQQQQEFHHKPPEGFVIAARVYTDPKDKLSHFDMDPTALTLTYWDCGVAGSTTPYISVKHAYFRHALAATTTVISSNDSYSYSSSSHSNSNPDSMHPVLVVALTPVTIEVNSGTVQHFQPGDVILLEDVLRPGHKMRPSHQHPSPPKKDQQQYHPADVQLLFLTMPHPYHHTGKDHVSLAALASNSRLLQRNPCPNPNTVSQASDSGSTSTTGQSDSTSPLESSGATVSSTIDRTSGATTGSGVKESSSTSSSSSRPYLVYQPPPSPFTQWWKHPNAGRWVVLGVAGLSTSTLMADFLGKTAPLWLAVGVGGGCFVAASTYSFCQAGNALWTAAEVWYYQRKLGESLSSSTTFDDEDEEDEQDHDDMDRLLQQETSDDVVFEVM